jgi:hypothetical protein
MARMADVSSAGPLTVKEIARRLELEKTQANAWLKRAVSEGKIEKLTKRIRYRMSVLVDASEVLNRIEIAFRVIDDSAVPPQCVEIVFNAQHGHRSRPAATQGIFLDPMGKAVEDVTFGR